ncbi:MAG: hypothetical protein NTX38_00470, partial [Methylobacter sp.]|nr:hypothetical protein [Methylobacter sp.]
HLRRVGATSQNVRSWSACLCQRPCGSAAGTRCNPTSTRQVIRAGGNAKHDAKFFQGSRDIRP